MLQIIVDMLAKGGKNEKSKYNLTYMQSTASYIKLDITDLSLSICSTFNTGR
jgi:hypothetical protein